MKIAIYGAGVYGEYIYNEIVHNDSAKVSVSFWIDNFNKEEQKYGLPVYTEEEFVKSSEFHGIDAVIVAINNTEKAQVADEIAASLLLHGFEKIYIALPNGFFSKIPVLNEEGYLGACVKFYKELKPTVGMMLTLVTKRCNMNCKRCFHLSNLVKEDEFLDLSVFESYLVQLKKKFKNILQFQLLGGEPLLNPQLDLFLALARKYFPAAKLEVVTNGLLITKSSPKLIDAMVKHNAYFYISYYPPIRQNIEKIIDFLEEKQINYWILPLRDQFRKWITFKEENGDKAYARWKANDCRCHVIDKGRIYQCPCIPSIYEKQDYFDLQIEEDELKDSSIDLMNDEIDGWEMMKYFSHSTPLCRYCYADEVWEKWETGQPDKTDWIVD